MIKCVVWDIDNTLLDGVYLESEAPALIPGAAAVLADLADRGILQAVASRNPPAAADDVETLLGREFAAAECGWGSKAEAIERIMSALGLAADAVAFVDDDPLERAEVSFAFAELLVLAPEEIAEAASWPQFSPPAITDEARRRGELYRNRQRRQAEAKAFAGSRDEFLRHSRTEVLIGPAKPADVPRLAELSVRTHQFNSTGVPVTEAGFAAQLDSPTRQVIAVWLTDKFGDDGLVGCSVIATGAAGRGAATWNVPLLMMSCRAMGRGVIDALLACMCRAACRSGASELALPCVINPRNVPLRIALVAAGFRADAEPAGGGTSASALYRRRLDSAVPELASWVIERTDPEPR